MYLPPDPPIPDYDPCAGKVSNVDRTLAKIKAASFRVGFNLWHIFQPLDEHGTNFVSESKFLSILLGPMKSIIGLDPFEISELTQYYKIEDGRVAYTRLCQQVHGKLSPPGQTEEERETELRKSNTLTPEEETVITDLLARISVTVTPRRMLIRPFFQDYELVQRDSGMVSKNTFVRVLHFLGAPLSPDELGLLILKYRHDSDTIKYEAFIKELDDVSNYLKKKDYVDHYGGLRDDYFGEVPKLPDMNMKPAPHGEHLGIQKVWSEGWKGGDVEAIETAEAFNKIREQVYTERLRVKDFFITIIVGCICVVFSECFRCDSIIFKSYIVWANRYYTGFEDDAVASKALAEDNADAANNDGLCRKHYDEEQTGRVSSDVMKTCLEWICVSETSFNDMYLTGREVSLILDIYEDPYYKGKSLWKVFQEDLERGVDQEELDAWPPACLDRRSAEPMEVLYRPPTPPENVKILNLNDVFDHILECMETLSSAKKLLSALAKCDGQKTAYISYQQFAWAFLECGIFLAPAEIEILRDKYQDELGVNWRYFAEDLSSYRKNLSLNRQQVEMEGKRKALEAEKRQKAELMEGNIIEILAKVKSYIICKRVWINDYLKIFDKHKKNVITKTEFERGLDQCGIKLSRKELDILLDVFCLPNDPEKIEYTRFCRTVDEDSLPPCLTKPLIEDVIKKSEQIETRTLPTHQWANFRQRTILAMAMDKLAKYVGLSSTDLFKGLDNKNTGTVSRSDLQRALFSLNCLHLITNNELDTIIHCFGFKKGHFIEIDYMSFLNALDIVIKTKAAAKNL